MTDMTAGGADEGGFKARAGALTLLHVTSQIERDILRRTLAEVTTGVILNKVVPPEPEEDLLHMRSSPTRICSNRPTPPTRRTCRSMRTPYCG
jgi:hypothetical protein